MEIVRVLLEVVLVVLVVARISRFGAEDVLAEPFRRWVVRRTSPYQAMRDPQHYGLIARGVHCRWCWSVWAAIPTAVTWWLISDTAHVWDRWYVDLPALVLGLSEAAAIVQAREPED